MISIAVLGIVAASLFGIYASGLQTLEAQSNADFLESAMRSKMEELLATKFDWLASGSTIVSYQGINYDLGWKVSGIDLDEDSFVDANAKHVLILLEGTYLETIVVNHKGMCGKI